VWESNSGKQTIESLTNAIKTAASQKIASNKDMQKTAKWTSKSPKAQKIVDETPAWYNALKKKV